MSEVADIEARLRAPVNSWLKGEQQRDFERLLVLARAGEWALAGLDDPSRPVPVCDRAPTPSVRRSG